MSYPSDLIDDQWELLEPVFNAAGKRGRKHADEPPRPLPTPGEIVREHHQFGDWLASGRLHRHHAAPPVPWSGPPGPGGARRVTVRLDKRAERGM